LNESQWSEATSFWMKRMGNDVRVYGQHAKVAIVYSDAFSKAQDALKPPPPMDAESYAALVVDIQKAGSPATPLAARGLSTADYLRLARHIAKRLASDPLESQAFARTYERLQAPSEESPPDGNAAAADP
jgi:hypothetical protein